MRPVRFTYSGSGPCRESDTKKMFSPLFHKSLLEGPVISIQSQLGLPETWRVAHKTETLTASSFLKQRSSNSLTEHTKGIL
jgi:hypothetical protein